MQGKEVLLFNPRTFHEKNYRNFWIPYSILSLGSDLTRANQEVALLDNNLQALDTSEFAPQLSLLHSPQLIGISSMIGHQIQEGLVFAKHSREAFPEAKIVWGGAAPTILPQEFIQSPLVDIVVKGQGEQTIVALLNALKKGSDLSTVEGLIYKEGDRVIETKREKPLPKSAAAPYAYDLIDTPMYVKADEHISDRVLNHISSLGCPYGCGFCSEVALYNRRWSPETMDRTMEEVSQLVEKYDANGIKFYDSNFFVNKNRVLAFARNVLAKDWDIKWAASAHPKSLLSYTQDELGLLRSSGLSRLLIGAESGNDDELEYIQKGATTSEIFTAAQLLSNFDIHASFTIIVGYPGFPEDNIQRTLDFGERIARLGSSNEVKAHVYAPFPGTPLYDLAIQHGFVPPKTLEDWGNFDYYMVQTPWLRSKLNDTINQYNKEFCPYVL